MSFDLYPPRIETAIRPDTLRKYRGFIAQFKYHDVRTLVSLPDLELRNRHRQKLVEYRITPSLTRDLHQLAWNENGPLLLDGGILRESVPKVGRPLILWDILVYDGRYLLGTPYRERYELLCSLCGNPRTPEPYTGQRIAIEVTREIWLAPCFERSENFPGIFARTLPVSYLEGLVLKNPAAPLERSLSESNNTRWQLKVRKPRTDYAF